MNDILPPKRPLNKPGGVSPRPTQGFVGNQARMGSAPVVAPPVMPQIVVPEVASPTLKKKPRKGLKITLWILGSLLALLVVAAALLYGWYTQSLQPVNTADQGKVSIDIVTGSTPADIGQLLEEKKLIRNKYAFDIYTRISDTRGKLQAGTYSLSPSESTEAIVAHLVSGRVDEVTVTFLPGATLADNKKVLIDAGYTEAAVTAALAKTYDHPLFASKPANTDLEGYIYGETYTFGSSATPEDILRETFDHYYDVVKQENLIEGFKKQDLSLYEGITLASIIQREVPTATDQKQVAQVFLTRLATGMQLGSDVTYQYAAKKLGVEPTPTLNSPYNTRKVVGLPPGPIATPGKSALIAVANPAMGNYIYFLSGDDDVTYFARTAQEHEVNIQQHCQKKCSIL